MLAYDGERDRVLPEGAVATVTVDRGGPVMIDVDRALWLAATRRLFDVTSRDPRYEEATDGD